jgi:hypothetical protein
MSNSDFCRISQINVVNTLVLTQNNLSQTRQTVEISSKPPKLNAPSNSDRRGHGVSGVSGALSSVAATSSDGGHSADSTQGRSAFILGC